MPISPDRILYNDHALLAVNKLAGELVVNGKGKVEKLPLFDFLKKDFPGIHPLNRLDFETSGIVLFARNRQVLADELAKKFKGWTKTYRTIVAGRIKKDRSEINMPLPSRTKGEGNVAALTRFRVIERFENATYVEVDIETGRHHQIRKHFQMIHHPLLLDEVYGDEKANKKFARFSGYRRFFLHAWKTKLPHPSTGQIVEIEAPMPRLFEEILKRLRG